MNPKRNGEPTTICEYVRRADEIARIPNGAVALVVDDLEEVRGAIKAMLTSADVRVIDAASSKEALDLARRHKIDLVLSDITRPGMNGLEFLRVFKKVYPHVPVIMVSTALTEQNERRAFSLGAFACVAKPFAAHEIFAIMGEALAGRNTGAPHVEPRGD